MKILRQLTIGKRIGTLVAVSVLVSILAISVMLVLLQVGESIKSKKAEVSATGYVYAAAIADHVAVSDELQTQNVLRSMSRIPSILYATALKPDGQTIASMGNTTFLQRDIVLEEQGAVAMLTKGVLPVAVDIIRGGQKKGRLVLMADIRPLRNNLILQLVSAVLAAIIASLFAASIAIPLQHRITQPILALISAMTRIKDGRDYSQRIEHKANDETGVLVETFNAMISELNFREKALERMAYFDSLTGLPNRQYFQREIDRLLTNLKGTDERAALVLLDLDDFKQINDTFGHTVGDGLLMNVAALLKQEATPGMEIARLGGDEFVVTIENVSTEDEVQERLAPFVASLLQPFKIFDHEIFVSTSVGIAMIPRDGNTSVELVRRADLALYSAKNQGHGFAHFYRSNLDAVVKKNSAIAQGLRLAISNNDFETHYQPQVDLSTGNVYGFECLIRWNHPDRGLIPPAQFIPIAESSGLINDIGRWILRDGCTQAQSWIKAGYTPREISVNVSAAQIARPDFLQEVSKILLETGFPPHLLCLELTESLFIGKAVGKVRRILEELRGLGVLLSLDDFGTGYSSLSYLEKLPFDKLKIDQSFVTDIENDLTKRKILNGIIQMTHSLGIPVVAEGVETVGEITLLGQLGADFVQGYAFSRPVAAADATGTADKIAREFSSNFNSTSAGVHNVVPSGGVMASPRFSIMDGR